MKHRTDTVPETNNGDVTAHSNLSLLFNEVHDGPGNFQCRETFPVIKESFSGEDIYNLSHLFNVMYAVEEEPDTQPFPKVQDPLPLRINKLSISDITELSCGEINTQADLYNEGPDTHQAGVNSGIIAHFEEPSRMPDPGYGDSIMVHFSLPPLFMGAEADTD